MEETKRPVKGGEGGGHRRPLVGSRSNAPGGDNQLKRLQYHIKFHLHELKGEQEMKPTCFALRRNCHPQPSSKSLKVA